jgi:tetratricopeptide (TPR) repeat protein
MKNLINIPKMISALALLSLGACSSAPFMVTSTPEQAEVYIVNAETKAEKKIGMTPLTKQKKELIEQLGDQAQAGNLVNVVVRKDGYRSKEIWLPVAAGGHIPTALNLSLETTTSKSDEMQTASDIMDKVFLAQQFANTKQLERALIEIDKVLEEFPKFDRAMTMKAAILYGQKNMQESLKWYENALDVNPELKSAVEMSGRIRKNLRLPARSSARVPAARTAKAKL